MSSRDGGRWARDGPIVPGAAQALKRKAEEEAAASANRIAGTSGGRSGASSAAASGREAPNSPSRYVKQGTTLKRQADTGLEELEAEAQDSGTLIDDDVRLPQGVLGRSYPEPVAQGDAAKLDLTADASPLDLCKMSETKVELCPIIEKH